MREYVSKRFQNECIFSGEVTGFNGNQAEFLRSLTYKVGITLGLEGIKIERLTDQLTYVLYGNLIPNMGSRTEAICSLVSGALGGPSNVHHNQKMAQLNFGVITKGFSVEVEPSEMYGSKQIMSAIDDVVAAMDGKRQPVLR